MTATAPNVEPSLPRLRGRAGVGAKIAPVLIIAYWITSVLGHLEVSLWLVRRRESDLLGSYKLADFLPHAGALLLAAIVIWQARRAWRGYNHAVTLTAWTAWFAAVALADRLLIYSFPEYLHYPQYALLAWMIARLHDPDRTAFAVGPILLAVTVLGIADEALQYTWITISYSNYLDFNDFLLNLLGGIAGLLLYYGFAPSPLSRHPELPLPRHPELDSGSSKQPSAPSGHKTSGSRITPRYARPFRDDEKGERDARPFRDDESDCHPELDSGSSKQPSAPSGHKTSGSRITPRFARPFRDDEREERGARPFRDDEREERGARPFRDDERGERGTRRFRDDESDCHPELDSGSSKQPSASGGHKATEPRTKPGITSMEASARRGLFGFACLGTLMLLSIAALQTAQTDPQLLGPIERQPSYNTWIPGPHAGRYYVLDPVTGALLLVGLGALASALPTMCRRDKLS